MSFFGALANIGRDVEHVFAPPQAPVRTFNTTAHATNHPPLTPRQAQNVNAKIEADGAAMYNAAHPGQQYRANQNGEFGPNELPANMYGQPLGNTYLPPIPAQFAPHLLNNFSPNFQVQPAQSYNPQPISLQQPYNPGNISLQPQGSAPRNVNNSMYFY